MQIGVAFPTTDIGHDLGAVREYAQAAEELGYGHIRVLDHVLGAVRNCTPNSNISFTPTRATSTNP